MPTLSKETKHDILDSTRLKTERVPVPEFGEDMVVIVSEMSGLARDSFISNQDQRLKAPVSEQQAALLLLTVVDESGELVLSDGDIPALRAQSFSALDRIADAAMRLNGMQPKAVEEAAKNSVAAPSGDSGSGSASTSESR
ncbi:hypothetical protein [Burkholderia cenocepacia]|uniref:hypothetical protein n=1 Tax=Burkholderia cenocepacia TaxID=95486 RepID=UPI0006AC4D8C|nr:hypothetical protein [Burkholderia cenocepacia]KOR22818.1 hypothetical protein ABW54_04670 [Burkholderia cenocepacia]